MTAQIQWAVYGAVLAAISVAALSWSRRQNLLLKPLPFRGGVGGGAVQQKPTCVLAARPHPNPSPEGEGLFNQRHSSTTVNVDAFSLFSGRI
jgi:hypothetical protein